MQALPAEWRALCWSPGTDWLTWVRHAAQACSYVIFFVFVAEAGSARPITMAPPSTTAVA